MKTLCVCLLVLVTAGCSRQPADTAATAAYALGLEIPAEWDGAPVYEAFGVPVERQSTACQ